jgi:hypothetical protein
MADSKRDQPLENRSALSKKLDAAGWGFFFIWTGIAFLADLDWGTGLLGVGMIGLATQAVRRYFGLAIDGFGLVIGIVFVVAGVRELLQLRLGEAPIPGGLMPILSIVIGAVLVVSALLRKRH